MVKSISKEIACGRRILSYVYIPCSSQGLDIEKPEQAHWKPVSCSEEV
jgi:hypothetical protein